MRNGAAPMTGDLNMDGHKVENLDTAVTDGDAVPFEQYSAAPTETTSGIVELATQAEAEGGTDNVRYMTPLRVLQGIQILFATAAHILAGTASKVLTADKLVDAGAFVTITPVANVGATDMALGRNFTVTCNANTTLSNPTSVKVGQVVTYEIVQGTGGSRLVTWGSNFKTGDGTMTLSTSEGDKDLVSWFAVSATRLAFLGIRKGVQ
jgi:hypothetical protein